MSTPPANISAPARACPRCHAALTPDADLCPACDQPLCPICSAAIGEDDTRCSACGTRFDLSCPACGATLTAGDACCPNCSAAFQSDVAPPQVVDTPSSINPTEKVDAAKVNDALRAYHGGDRETARRLLEEVVANCPEAYVYRFVEDRIEYIKFWDTEEFLTCVAAAEDERQRGVTMPDLDKIIMLQSAYPRAYFNLGCLAIDDGDAARARDYLETCLRLEPDQPNAFIDLAIIDARQRQPQRAIECYDRALQARPLITASVKATALRGKGTQLIELGELDQAEQQLKASLVYEPANPRTLNELEYIRRMRLNPRRLPAPLRLHHEQPTALACMRCGRPLATGTQVLQINGVARYLCSECQSQPVKRWWEFWKR